MNLNMIRFQYGFAWALLLVLAVVTVFGSYLMPYTINPGDKVTIAHQMVDGHDTIVSPPFAPSSEHWLGTDHRGYDMLSLLLNGAKYTIGFGVLVTAARFALAIVIGLYSGATGRFRRVIHVLQTITSSVPPLLLLFPALYGISTSFRLNMGLQPDDPRITLFEIILFLMMVLAGLFPLANQLAERARFFNEKEFVTVSRSLGASTSRIVFRHLLPHLRPELLYGFITEMVQVLFLIGQFAVLSIFVGGSEPFYLDENSLTFISLTITGEWGGLIAYGTHFIRSYPWLIASPAFFLAVSVLILSLFAHVLQKRLEHPAYYQPGRFWKNKPRLAVVGAVAAACIALVAFMPNQAPSAVTALSTDGPLNRSEMEERVLGSGEEFSQTLPAKATQFMQHLAENKWSYAEVFFATGSSGKTNAPSAPWDKWLEALSSKQYQFTGIGRITKSKATGNQAVIGAGARSFDVEVKVKNPSGQEETWVLVMPGTERINAAKGGPGQSVSH